MNILNNFGNTVLTWESCCGDLEVVHELLAHDRVDVNIRDQYGKTALALASQNCHLEVDRPC